MNPYRLIQGQAHIAPGGGAPNEHIDLGPPTTKDLELGGVDPPPHDEGFGAGGVRPPPPNDENLFFWGGG